MSQSRAFSAIEAVTNVTIGWVTAFATQLLVFPAVGLQATVWQHATVSFAFTALSVTRSYALRRAFARLETPGGPLKFGRSHAKTDRLGLRAHGHDSDRGSVGRGRR